MKKLVGLFTLLLVTGLLFSAIGSGQQLTIGVSTNALLAEHNRRLFESTEVEILTAGHKPIMTNANGIAVQQMQDIETLIVRNVDALIIQNGDTDALRNVILQAANAGIPVVSVQTGFTPGVDVVLQANEFIVGAQIATYLAALINYEGKVVTMYHNNHPAIRTRGRIIEAVVSEYSSLEKITQHTSVFPGTAEDAYKATESLILAHPDIVAFFCSQDNEAVGVAKALQAAGRTDVLTIGVDGEIDALRIIKEGGSIVATVIQDLELEAKMSVEAAIKLAKGEVPGEKIMWVPYHFVTQENVDEFLK